MKDNIEDILTELKDFFIFYLDQQHDLFASTSDESIEFYKAVWNEYESYKKKLTEILTNEKYKIKPF